MRRLADRFVNWLLRLAPWYKPEEIEAREVRAEKNRKRSIAARIDAEEALGSYGRVRIGR